MKTLTNRELGIRLRDLGAGLRRDYLFPPLNITFFRDYRGCRSGQGKVRVTYLDTDEYERYVDLPLQKRREITQALIDYNEPLQEYRYPPHKP